MAGWKTGILSQILEKCGFSPVTATQWDNEAHTKTKLRGGAHWEAQGRKALWIFRLFIVTGQQLKPNVHCILLHHEKLLKVLVSRADLTDAHLGSNIARLWLLGDPWSLDCA